MADGVIGGSSVRRELAALSAWADPAQPISVDERLTRIAKAQAELARMDADALLVGAGSSLSYFTGVGWSVSERLVAMLLFRNGARMMICPRFEVGSMEASLAFPIEIATWEEHESPTRLCAELLSRADVGRLAIDPTIPFSVVERLRAAARAIEEASAAPVIDACRMIKSPAELALIRQAMGMTIEVQRRAARILHQGIRASAVVRFIDQAHRALGADDGSSFCAVQFGTASAYPHGLPGDRTLARGDIVLIDTGCRVQGYNSDITRTYVFGEPTAEQRRIWDLEKQAQAAAFAAVRPGVACELIDAAARQVIVGAGLGPDYELPGLGHRTGHGIGLSIHEAPYLVRGDTTQLQPGMCFSNEPMIVLPERFGVRLEDHFHVTEAGAEWFTQPQPAIDRVVA